MFEVRSIGQYSSTKIGRNSYVRFNPQGMDAAVGPDGNGTNLP